MSYNFRHGDNGYPVGLTAGHGPAVLEAGISFFVFFFFFFFFFFFLWCLIVSFPIFIFYSQTLQFQ